MFSRSCFTKLYSMNRKILLPSKTNALIQNLNKLRLVERPSSTKSIGTAKFAVEGEKSEGDARPQIVFSDAVAKEAEDDNSYTIENESPVTRVRNPFWDITKDIKNSEPSDVPHFIDDIGPTAGVSFNLAAYANMSPTLQKLIELGVDLSRIERKAENAKFIVSLDFETHIKPYVQFLHDMNVEIEDMGKLLSKNPMFLKEDLENLQIRINYLESKKFSSDAITKIISKNPFYLMHDTKYVDNRLGFFQQTYRLTGDEVRFLIAKYPKLVSYSYFKIMEKNVVFKEFMGFTDSDVKQLLLMKPKVWMLARRNLENRFEVAHNLMGLSHNQILQYPGILLKREFLLEQRHRYLLHLERAQYDPKKPGYVPIKEIAATTDYAFCKSCAKTSVDQYNEFLKTL